MMQPARPWLDALHRELSDEGLFADLRKQRATQPWLLASTSQKLAFQSGVIGGELVADAWACADGALICVCFHAWRGQLAHPLLPREFDSAPQVQQLSWRTEPCSVAPTPSASACTSLWNQSTGAPSSSWQPGPLNGKPSVGNARLAWQPMVFPGADSVVVPRLPPSWSDESGKPLTRQAKGLGVAALGAAPEAAAATRSNLEVKLPKAACSKAPPSSSTDVFQLRRSPSMDQSNEACSRRISRMVKHCSFFLWAANTSFSCCMRELVKTQQSAGRWEWVAIAGLQLTELVQQRRCLWAAWRAQALSSKSSRLWIQQFQQQEQERAAWLRDRAEFSEMRTDTVLAALQRCRRQAQEALCVQLAWSKWKIICSRIAAQASGRRIAALEEQATSHEDAVMRCAVLRHDLVELHFAADASLQTSTCFYAWARFLHDRRFEEQRQVLLSQIALLHERCSLHCLATDGKGEGGVSQPFATVALQHSPGDVDWLTKEIAIRPGVSSGLSSCLKPTDINLVLDTQFCAMCGVAETPPGGCAPQDVACQTEVQGGLAVCDAVGGASRRLLAETGNAAACLESNAAYDHGQPFVGHVFSFGDSLQQPRTTRQVAVGEDLKTFKEVSVGEETRLQPSVRDAAVGEETRFRPTVQDAAVGEDLQPQPLMRDAAVGQDSQPRPLMRDMAAGQDVNVQPLMKDAAVGEEQKSVTDVAVGEDLMVPPQVCSVAVGDELKSVTDVAVGEDLRVPPQVCSVAVGDELKSVTDVAVGEDFRVPPQVCSIAVGEDCRMLPAQAEDAFKAEEMRPRPTMRDAAVGEDFHPPPRTCDASVGEAVKVCDTACGEDVRAVCDAAVGDDLVPLSTRYGETAKVCDAACGEDSRSVRDVAVGDDSEPMMKAPKDAFKVCDAACGDDVRAVCDAAVGDDSVPVPSDPRDATKVCNVACGDDVRAVRDVAVGDDSVPMPSSPRDAAKVCDAACGDDVRAIRDAAVGDDLVPAPRATRDAAKVCDVACGDDVVTVRDAAVGDDSVPPPSVHEADAKVFMAEQIARVQARMKHICDRQSSQWAAVLSRMEGIRNRTLGRCTGMEARWLLVTIFTNWHGMVESKKLGSTAVLPEEDRQALETERQQLQQDREVLEADRQQLQRDFMGLQGEAARLQEESQRLAQEMEALMMSHQKLDQERDAFERLRAEDRDRRDLGRLQAEGSNPLNTLRLSIPAGPLEQDRRSNSSGAPSFSAASDALRPPSQSHSDGPRRSTLRKKIEEMQQDLGSQESPEQRIIRLIKEKLKEFRPNDDAIVKLVKGDLYEINDKQKKVKLVKGEPRIYNLSTREWAPLHTMYEPPRYNRIKGGGGSML